MKIHEVMTHPVVSVRPQTSVSKAAQLLVSRGFGAAPVRTAEGQVLGITTEADLVRARCVPMADDAKSRGEPTVSDVMTPAPLCVGPNDEVSEVALQMLRTGDRSVLVLEGSRLVGIVTSRDLLGAIGGGSP